MKNIANQTNVWKYNPDGSQRPLQDQLNRRKADLAIAEQQANWYDKNPLGRNQLEIMVLHNKRILHLQGIYKDINSIEKKLKS